MKRLAQRLGVSLEATEKYINIDYKNISDKIEDEASADPAPEPRPEKKATETAGPLASTPKRDADFYPEKYKNIKVCWQLRIQ